MRSISTQLLWFMEEHLDPEYFIKVADKCIEAGGNNNFIA